MAKQVPELSETLLEIGRKFYPTRYRRFKDLRPFNEACEWACGLDWRNNPYDRFLLRRELLHYLEDTAFYEAGWNIFNYASRAEIAAQVDVLLDNFPNEHEQLGVFLYVVITVPWDLAFRHGRVQYSKLSKAMANWPSQEGRC